MIGDWLAQAPVILVAVAVVFVPGAIVGAALRLRGLALWALAPVGSIVILAVAAVVLAIVGIPWSALSIAGVVVAAGVLAWVATFWVKTPERVRVPRAQTVLLVSALAVGALWGAFRFGLYVGDPAAISQTNDAVFHLNALRWILEYGSASSFQLSAVVDGSGFYPGAWHAVVSAVMLFTGADIPIAVNAVSLAIVAGIWPLGIAWFTRTVVAGHVSARVQTWAPVFAGALASALPVFPLLMFQWGVLYPFALGVALVPAAAAIIVVAPQWIGGRGPVVGKVANVTVVALLAFAGIGALALAQPASLLAWAIIVTVSFVGWCLSRIPAVAPAQRLVLVAVSVVVLAAFVTLWAVLTRSTSGVHWGPFTGKSTALLDVLLNSHIMLPAGIAMSVLMVIGIVAAVRVGKLCWLVVAWVLFSGLYVVSAAFEMHELRLWLLGAWYADPNRMASLVALTVIPLAALGLASLVAWVGDRLAPRFERGVGAVAVIVIALVGVISLVVVPVIQMPRAALGLLDTQTRYSSNNASFLSPDERTLLERLDDTVPEDAVVFGNPSTGSGFGYVLSGRTVYPKTWAPPRSEAWDVLAGGLRDAAHDDAVCDALEAYGFPEFVLDFGPGVEEPGKYVMPGFTDFDGQDGFELVDEVGDASLWRITACAT